MNVKNFKQRIISFILVVVMVVGIMPLSVTNVIAEDSDFIIENGVLIKYVGSGFNVIIPNSVTSISNEAFYFCRNLTSIIIPNSVTSIGDEVFYNCDSLINITVDSQNKKYSSVDGVLFDKQKAIIIQYPMGKTNTLYSIPNSVTSIGDSAFHSCHNLTSIIIPNSVTSIGDSAFYYCNNLTNIMIPNSVTSIGDNAFYDCDSLTSITIPNSVTSIGNNAFSHCDSLINITIPNSVTYIGDSAFYNCDSLTSIIIPNSVTSIGVYAFCSCDSLTSIIIPNSVTSIGSSTFVDCDNLTSIIISNSVTSIGSSTFANCNNLTSIIIPNSVTSIGDNAFRNCNSLTSITIPNSVTSIGRWAFYYCDNLTIYLQDNSYAHKYAIENKIKFVIINNDDIPINIPDELSIQAKLEIKVGETYGLTANLQGDNIDWSENGKESRECIWTSSDTSVVELSSSDGIFTSGIATGDGIARKGSTIQFIKGVGIGTSTITIELNNGNSVSCVVTVVENSDNGDNDNNGDNKITIPIRSLIADNNGRPMEFPWDFTYNDNLFAENSYIYNHDLAKMSLGMAIAGYSAVDSDIYWGENNDVNRQAYLENAYTDLGFEERDYINYDRSLNDNSSHVALGLAKKTININGESHTLISVVLRGGGYGAEWSDNFNIGDNSTGYHEGFYESSKKVVAYINYYIARLIQSGQIVGDIKLWITGYSRSAAIANLTTAELDKQFEKSNLVKLENVYTYGFATPQGVITKNNSDFNETNKKKFNNIFNIINPSDIVPTVAFSESGWDFGRYGIDKVFPRFLPNTQSLQQYLPKVKDYYTKVSYYYNAITQFHDIFYAYDTSGQYLVIQELEKILINLIPNTSEYKQKYQKIITELLTILMDNTRIQHDKAPGGSGLYYWGKMSIKDTLTFKYGNKGTLTFIKYDVESTIKLLEHPYIALLINLLRFKENNPYDIIIALMSICELNGFDANEFISELTYEMQTIVGTLIGLTEADVLNSHSFNIAQAHYPEIYTAWMFAYDNENDLFGQAAFKKMVIGCPVNVNIYNSEGELLASIIDNKIIVDYLPVIIKGDIKEIYIYGQDNYKIEIIATDSGTMNYYVKEFDEIKNQIRQVNFMPINLLDGMIFSGEINNETEIPIENYKLISDYNGEIQTIFANEDLKDDNVHNINISVKSNGNGFVSGNQIVSKGDFVTVIATPKENEEFIGWYENGMKINKAEEIYTFITTANRVLEAKFTSNTTNFDNGNNEQPIVDNNSNENNYIDYQTNEEKTENNKTITTISELTEEQKKLLEQALKKAGLTSAGKGIYITVPIDIDENEKPLYVKVKVDYIDNFDPAKISYYRLNDDGTFTPVPTEYNSNKGEIIIYANTSGIYVSVINENSFSDVNETDWFYKYVNEAVALGIVNGRSKKIFDPLTATSFADTVAMLFRAMGISQNEIIANEYWGKPYVDKAVLLKIYNEKWQADKVITREEMAIITANSLKMLGISKSLTNEEINEILKNFCDIDNIMAEAKEAMAICVKEKLIIGVSEEIPTLDPQGNFTRAQMATIAIRFRKLFIEKITTK